MGSVTAAVDSGSKAVLYGQILLNFVVNTSLSEILGIISQMQLVVFLPLLKSTILKFPAHTNAFLEKLIEIATVEIFATGEWLSDFTGLTWD